jgi:predicted RNA-binding Zn ribbon-like protein
VDTATEGAGASRAGSVRLVGGRPCLDLVNTVSWRGDESRREDHLRSGSDALVWLRRTGVLTAPEVDELSPVADAVLTALLAVREPLGPFADGAAPGPALQAGIRDAIAHSDLGPTGWTVSGLDARTAARRVLLDAYELARLPGARLGRCADPACGWVFQDTSKGGTRRWCSSADCGNRDRARRHYERTRSPGPGD